MLTVVIDNQVKRAKQYKRLSQRIAAVKLDGWWMKARWNSKLNAFVFVKNLPNLG